MPDEKPIDLNDPDYEDPILAELWRIREAMAAELNHDIGAMIRSVQEEESRISSESFARNS